MRGRGIVDFEAIFDLLFVIGERARERRGRMSIENLKKNTTPMFGYTKRNPKLKAALV